MFRPARMLIVLEVLYRSYFDATGDLPDRAAFYVDMRKALQYVPGSTFLE